MPPIRKKSKQDLAHQEGRILLAIQAIQREEISSIRDVAMRFQVPRTTLARRLNGITNRADTRPSSHKMT
jgi:hypothetical protein